MGKRSPLHLGRFINAKPSLRERSPIPHFVNIFSIWTVRSKQSPNLNMPRKTTVDKPKCVFNRRTEWAPSKTECAEWELLHQPRQHLLALIRCVNYA